MVVVMGMSNKLTPASLDPVMDRLCEIAFNKRYWDYSEAVPDTVRLAAQQAFKAGVAFVHDIATKELVRINELTDRLEICQSCGGPRFKGDYCPSNKICDL